MRDPIEKGVGLPLSPAKVIEDDAIPSSSNP